MAGLRFKGGFEKTAAISPKRFEAALAAAVRRSGNDPKKLRLSGQHSLGGITEPRRNRIPEIEHTEKWKMRALQLLFPKNKKLSEKSVTRRLRAALYGSPFTGTQGSGMRLVKAVQEKIEKTKPNLTGKAFYKKLGE